VALARALACRPEVLLLDEPLSALDPNFREELRLLIKEIHQSRGVTVLMVSHDFSEVLFLAGRVAVIHQGRIQQAGSAEDIFQRPANPFVANFVGMKNILPCRFQGTKALLNGWSLELDRTHTRTEGRLGLRPEDLKLHLRKPDSAGPNLVPARVTRLVDLGLAVELSLQAGEEELRCRAERELMFEPALAPGGKVWLTIPPEAIHVL
jgi:molybdate/tungstate transport system ATP-binding protein